MDETEPLLADRSFRDAEQAPPKDVAAGLDFSADDPENPLNWPPTYKWVLVALLSCMAFTTTFTCIGVVPVASSIVRDLDPEHRPDKSASVLLVTVWELGEAAGPLVIGPLSEYIGRAKVYNVANMLFILATVLAATAHSNHVLIAARGLTGLAVASNVLSPAIVGDIFQPEYRGTAVSFVVMFPMIGGAIGPVIAGVVTEHLGWRYVLWICAGLAAACELAFLAFLRETYKITILKKRTGDDPAVVGSEKNTLTSSIFRPFHMVWHSAVLMSMSVYGALTFTFYYIMATTLPDILQDAYGLSPSKTGLCFITMSVGSLISVIVCNQSLDRIYVKLKEVNKSKGKPEYRLPLTLVGSIVLPSMIIFFGWAVQQHLPLPIVLVAVGLIGGFLLFGYLPLTSYIVDAFGVYSASAMTAGIVIRCVAGTFLPLTTKPLVDELGYGWAFTLLAGIIGLGAAPVPFLIYRYGERWRTRSVYTAVVS